MKDEGGMTPSLATRSKAVGGRWLRAAAAVAAGNVLGYAAWAGASLVIPQLWAGRGAESHLLALIGLISLSVVLLAAPPVLVGAFTGWLARRWHLWVGLASGLWAVGLIGRVPAEVPIAGGFWYAPTVLVMLSGALGAWSTSGLMDEG